MKNDITTERAIEVLKAHNEWRRDDNIPNSKAMVNPTELGKALDKAIEVMENELRQHTDGINSNTIS